MKDLKNELKEWKKSFFEEMEEEMKKMKNKLMNELKNEIDEKVKEVKNELVNEVKKKINSEGIGGTEENEELRMTVKDLEWRAEMNERKEKKNNVIIAGKFEFKNVKVDVKKWIEDTLGIEAKISDAWKIADEITVIKCENFEEKKKIYEERKKLKGSNIFLSDDYTKKEREIQKELKRRSIEEKQKGKKIMIRYKKLIVNGAEWVWDENKKDLFRKKEE